MAAKSKTSHKNYITPLNINGLRGRMLRMPPPPRKKREILLIYGHHASLERMYGVAEDINQYGGVTMPDLPGFGGMESFYKIGMKPTIDNLADYLAAFIKLRYKRSQVTIAGMSFGFVVVTRMLQRYPELVKKVDLLISIVGFAHKDDFVFSKPRYFGYLYLAKFFSMRGPAFIFKNVFLHPLVIKTVYKHTYNAKKKFEGLNNEELKEALDFEVYLWRCNEVKTYMSTSVAFLTLDNCNKRVDLPLWHISVDADRYFSNDIVEQHMRIIFSEFNEVKATLDNHAPSVIADAAAAAPMIPKRMRQELNRNPA